MSTPPLEPPLAAAREYLARSRLLRVDLGEAARYAATVAGTPPGFWGPPYLRCADGFAAADVITFTLAVMGLNFCFWNPEPGAPAWRVRGKTGSGALTGSFLRGLEAGMPLTDPGWYASLAMPELRGLLRGDPEGPELPPLIEERLRILTEMGSWLGAQPPTRMLSGFQDAWELAAHLGQSLEGFRDVTAPIAPLGGERIAFLKRAQLFTSALWPLLGDQAPVWLGARGRLTAFADYRVPQSLRHVGVLRYGPELAAQVDAGRLLEPGGATELALRCGALVGTSVIARAASTRERTVIDVDVDPALWWMAHQATDMAPYHRCLTHWY
jgi:hypothetical protein